MPLPNRFAVDLQALPQAHANANTIHIILGVIFTITGAISLLIITIAGFRYVTSQGNPQSTAQAKNTIIYAVVGLMVSISAFAIVTFVLNNI